MSIGDAKRTLAVGDRADVEFVVHNEDSADQQGNRGYFVLSTPALARMFESTAITCVAQAVPDGGGSVGVELSIHHAAATPVGMKVTVRARVTTVDGRRIGFELEARDDAEAIATGSHVRYIIDRARFLDGVDKKRSAAGL